MSSIYVIGMKLCTKYVDVVTQEEDFAVVVRPDPSRCDEFWIGGEGNGKSVLVCCPQRREVDYSSPGRRAVPDAVVAQTIF